MASDERPEQDEAPTSDGSAPEGAASPDGEASGPSATTKGRNRRVAPLATAVAGLVVGVALVGTGMAAEDDPPPDPAETMQRAPLPTGSERRGLGKGYAVFEPFATFGQLLPRDSFIQMQGGFAIPLEGGHDDEVFWRAAVGKSFEQSRFGRVWSPMVEILFARPLASDTKASWDLLPGVQVTLNARQHVRLAGGVRLPVTDADVRKKSVIVYLLWDWYEGGFLQGW